MITFPTFVELSTLDGPQILERLLAARNARLMNLRTAIKYANHLFVRRVIDSVIHGLIVDGLRKL